MTSWLAAEPNTVNWHQNSDHNNKNHRDNKLSERYSQEQTQEF